MSEKQADYVTKEADGGMDYDGVVFGMVPKGVLTDKQLSDGAKLLLCHFFVYRDRYSGAAWPGQKRLARELRVSRRTINGRVSELKERGWIEVQRRGLEKTNRYIIHTKPQIKSDGKETAHQDGKETAHKQTSEQTSKQKTPVEVQNQDQKPPPMVKETTIEEQFKAEELPQESTPSSVKERYDSLVGVAAKSLVAKDEDPFARWPADIRAVVQNFCKDWFITQPGGKKDFAYWIERSRAIVDACGDLMVCDVMGAVRSDYTDFTMKHGRVPFTVEGPGSLVKVVRAKAGEIRSGKGQLEVKRYGDGSLHI